MKIFRIAAGTILVLIASLVTILIIWKNTSYADMYQHWLEATPTVNSKEKKEVYKVKKASYSSNFVPPSTRTEQVSQMTKNNLDGVRYYGTIRTMNMHLNVNIYDGISNQIFNTGNAGAYQGFDFNSGNSTIAAHTYAELGWNYYDGLTMIQKEMNVGDKFYAYDGNKNYYEYEVFNKEVIPAKNGIYITDRKRSEDKQFNPSGKPVLTMYDCYEPATGFLKYPPDRNVVYSNMIKKYDKNNVPKNIKNLFRGMPTYYYDEKTKTMKVKDASRKGNLTLQFEDFLFRTLKVQKLISLLNF